MVVRRGCMSMRNSFFSWFQHVEEVKKVCEEERREEERLREEERRQEELSLRQRQLVSQRMELRIKVQEHERALEEEQQRRVGVCREKDRLMMHTLQRVISRRKECIKAESFETWRAEVIQHKLLHRIAVRIRHVSICKALNRWMEVCHQKNLLKKISADILMTSMIMLNSIINKSLNCSFIFFFV